MPGAEFEVEKRRSKLKEGKRSRRRKRETERNSDTHLQSPDAMSGCSFDHQTDELLLNLARGECTNGPVPVLDPDHEKEKRIIEAENPDFQQENQDPPRNSFKECQNRRYSPDSIPSITRKLSRQRPVSLDLNSQVSADVATLSPFVGLGVMNKKSLVNFASPGTAVYQHQPGWHSERVPLGRQSYNRAAFPFNRGRNLPSKWEDAERWISSPLSGELTRRVHVPQLNRRRPHSKSGPLGSPRGADEAGLAASPTAKMFNNHSRGSYVKSSPLWAGVLIPEGGAISGNCTVSAPFPNCAIVGGWLDTPAGSSCSLPSSRGSVQDDRIEVTRKDIGTQTSPCISLNSSPKATRLSISSSKSITAHQVEEELESHFTELKIENSFKADNRVTLTRWSKKHVVQGPDKCLTNIIEWKRRTVEAKASSWQVAKNANCISKLETEEAKIMAWENMQKVKAEAAIEELVMKLERKRSSSMDKILNKLKFAQKKAQEMRTETRTSSNKTQEISKGSKQVPHFYKNGQMTSLSGCFTCHTF
ncbi:Remorin family protein [Rhynchospora pubera]|uniref:Remorin family protein n=1 Tax=Rhynchospora pubera TaxID=906938 RepID=A0AAV8H9H7_9POAL|nr:Remorin family protein [Rhynchospora pubera]